MVGTTLIRRKQLLSQLGYETLASRSSWSHDLRDSIVFDAWEDHWERDAQGNMVRYPLRTNGQHYNLAESRRKPTRGHTRWQKHVDLVLEGKRGVRAIVPVPSDPNAWSSRGAKGWCPYVIEGRTETDVKGQVWLYVVRLVSDLQELSRAPALPEEILSPGDILEGARTTIAVNAYERDAVARRRCIEKWGFVCVACGFDFGRAYGVLGQGFIHVHHLVPLSTIRGEYRLNPERDLRPVCPNCHAMLHRQSPPLTIKQLVQALTEGAA